MRKSGDITKRLTQELARQTTQFVRRAFESREMMYPHPAEVSKVIDMDPDLHDKYEPVIREHHSREQKRLAMEEEGMNPSPRNRPGMGGK